MKFVKDVTTIDPQKIKNPDVRETYVRISNFFTETLGRDEQILAERDLAISNTKGKGYIFYPESFKKLIDTNPVKRMARIFQLGTQIYEKNNVNHTRLEHSKGTYYRTLELFDNLFQKEDFRSKIMNLNAEKYVIACLIRALLHDLGHGPFSHTMEIICGLPKGFHEDITLRMIRENKELRDALEEICPGMPEIYEETIRKNFLGLNSLFEGQIDVDRGDFMVRDCYHANKVPNFVSQNVSELFQNVSIESVEFEEEPGKIKKRTLPVFEADQIGNLDTFFTNRYKNYKLLYFTPKARSYDNIYRAFAKELIKSNESGRLKKFLMNNMGKRPEEVDLDEYIAFNDVEYMKGIIEVLDTTENELLRKLALMSLPPKSQVPDIYHGLMVSVEQANENGERVNMTDTDEDFIKRLFELEGAKEEYDRNCLCITSGKKEDVDSFIENVKKELGQELTVDQLEDLGIYSWNPTVVAYKNKPGEETYVRGRDGKVYEYSEHPDRDRSVLRLKESVPGCCVLLPVLEARGIEPEKINRIKEAYLDVSKGIETKSLEEQ